MRYCNKCKVTISNDFPNCPLCKQKTIKRGNSFEQDFPMEMKKGSTYLNNVNKLFIFIFVFLLGLNVLINILFHFKLIWAPYFIVLLFYAHILVRVGIKAYRNIGTVIMSSVFMLSIASFILDKFLGFYRWSVNYVIPFLILAGILALIILIIIKPIYFVNYIFYILIVAFFGIALIAFLLLNIVTVRIPCLITVFASFMAIVAMFMFGDKSVKNELTRRFHF